MVYLPSLIEIPVRNAVICTVTRAGRGLGDSGLVAQHVIRRFRRGWFPPVRRRETALQVDWCLDRRLDFGGLSAAPPLKSF